MELHKIEFDMAQLKALDESEQIFFIKLGELHNNTQTLVKNLLYTVSKTYSDEIEESANHAQTFLYQKLLCGVLYEGWVFIKDNQIYFKQFEKELTEENRKYHKELNKYFGKENSINKIRNKYAFHNDADVIKESLGLHSDDEKMDFYISNESGNNFFRFSHTLVNQSMIKTLGLELTKEALLIFDKEIIQVWNWIDHITLNLLAVIAQKMSAKKNGSVYIDAISVSETVLPYFALPSQQE